jgi:hypothetical protein
LVQLKPDTTKNDPATGTIRPPHLGSVRLQADQTIQARDLPSDPP